MITYGVRALTGCLLLGTFLALFGCALRSAPKVNYFSLLSMDQLGDSQVIAVHPKIKLGIGPVTAPERLKRSQIATSQHGNQHTFDEFNRWAGVLEKDITAVVGDNLGILLGVKEVGYFPWLNHFTPTYWVVIDIQRLDGTLGGEAVLGTRWSVFSTENKEFLAGGRDVFRRQSEDSSFAALVKAESLLLADLSKKIAGEIDRLIAKQAP